MDGLTPGRPGGGGVYQAARGTRNNRMRSSLEAELSKVPLSLELRYLSNDRMTDEFAHVIEYCAALAKAQSACFPDVENTGLVVVAVDVSG